MDGVHNHLQPSDPLASRRIQALANRSRHSQEQQPWQALEELRSKLADEGVEDRLLAARLKPSQQRVLNLAFPNQAVHYCNALRQ